MAAKSRARSRPHELPSASLHCNPGAMEVGTSSSASILWDDSPVQQSPDARS
jgi:hypothetical protein